MTEKLEPGSQLSHYQILASIGAGGMGEVYLAHDPKLDRKVAIKLLHKGLGDDADKVKRFVREAKAASALNHPNILTVYEIGEADDKNYIATEFIEGKTLRDHLSTRTLMPISRVLKLAIQIGEALVAAHDAGIIHRDIKPENIMIRDDGYAKVLDFGLAKLSEQTLGNEDVTHFHTTPGMIMGTVAYMSPEQARGADLDRRSDIFSLGTVLYEMVTGRQPFSGETTSHAIIAILEHEPAGMSLGDGRVPEALERITFQALAKDRDERYQSASELINELKVLRRQLEFATDLERSMSPDQAHDGLTTKILQVDTSSGTADGNTIAVMPFVNMSRDENGDYFSDGLAEELLNVLSKIRGLRVAARTSAFSFKGKSATIREIGRTLNVASVLEGSIRMAGERVRIAVQLVKVADGYHLWSETYDRTMDDIFTVQDDIAQSVVGELRVRLLGETPGNNSTAKVVNEVADAVRGRAAAPEAQRLMLLGRHFIDRTTREDTEKAVGYFREALDLDPGYALCWAELGRAYSVQAGKVWTPVDEGYANARAATEKALELEPDLAEAYAQLGRIQSAYEMDMLAARSSYQKALELAPGSSMVVDGASILEFKLGHFDDALEMSRQVLSQDPLSGSVWHNLGLICHSAGLLPESETSFRRALEMGQRRTVTTAMLALVLLEQGRNEDAVECAEAEPDPFWRSWAKSIILHQLDRHKEAEAALLEITGDAGEGDAYQIAEVYAVWGQKDDAFEWLGRAADERDPGVTHAKASPLLRPLHDDKRWLPFLKRIGLSD